MDKRKRLREIMKGLRANNQHEEWCNKKRRNSMVRYHSPYVDTSGEQFYLPKKWHRFGDDQWKECDVNYSFKKNEMNGGDLIRNLRWLGNSGSLISKLMNEETPCNDDSSDDDIEADDGLIGHGPRETVLKKTGTFVVHYPKCIAR